MLKRSRYLHLVHEDGRAFVYSALSGGMLALAPEAAAVLAQADAEQLDELSQACPELLAIGALVSDEVDERDLLHIRIGRERFGTHALDVTIAPTMACNLRCTYCDQPDDSRAHTMSDEISTAVLDYLDGPLDAAELLGLTWYGGEPLLALGRVLEMQERILDRCAEHNTSLFATVVTNGLLLDEKVAGQLEESGIRVAQVTIDGPPEIHDRRRPLAGGGGTFQRILGNLASARRHLTLRIRVNIDRENAPELPRLLDTLGEHDLLGDVYIAAVVGYESPCAGHISHLLGGDEFGEVLNPILDRLPDEEISGRLSPSSMPCTALREATLVFGPQGHVYRCWHELGEPDRAFDHVLTGEGSPERRVFWLRHDPIAHQECDECPVLPLCVGGCPERRVRGVGVPSCCTPLRDHLPAYIREHARRSAG